MKLSNFVLLKVTGAHCVDRRYFAEVDVTTGHLLWRKTERKAIWRPSGMRWRFVDTGLLTPDNQAENLERVWDAKHGGMSVQF